ncbi:MAG TPA: FG-GAP-like repeat-containing protein [Candidatus Krumholzibacteria bacterium]|nr:FG-GAP-like repeat-containing protein [Candidatus Krumholzibacteria bacterium]HRX52126.1 FG-GAP-like repeat-containing protein [Candidatus Krumholzibacteria bacterium]
MTSRSILSALFAVIVIAGAADAAVCELDVPVCGQENSEWCWAGCSQAILAFYGFDVTQEQIAAYGTLGVNTWNWLYGSDESPRRYGIDAILDHFAGIPTSPWPVPMPFSTCLSEMCAQSPYVIRWGWTTGGGHFLVGWGASDAGGQIISYMNPLPVGVGGHHVASWDWMLQDANHTWTHSLTTDPVAGSVEITVLPEGLQAPWELDGPDGFQAVGVGDSVLTAVPAGDYAVTWQTAADVFLPVEPTAAGTHAGVGRLSFQGAYRAPFTALPGADGPSRGVAIGDLDRDGDPDVAVSRHGAANLILRNDGGLLTDIAAGPAADPGPAAGIVLGDYDDDGVLDLFLARPGAADLLLHGAGDGGFDASQPVIGLGDTGEARGAAWCDFDGDGRIDLSVARDGADDLLYRNIGDIGGAHLFAPQSGPAAQPGAGRAHAWGDADGDGDADLYVIKDGEPNALLVSDPFTGFQISSDPVLANGGPGSAAAWCDADNDGDLDLYLANAPGLDRLLRNGGGAFSVVADAAPAAAGSTRGVVWADLDNDGDADLYLARDGEPDLLLRNEGAMAFTALPIPDSDDGAVSAAAADLDGDGDLDVYVAVDGAPDRVMRNDHDPGRHWLHLDLRAADANRDAVGARVRLHAGAAVQTREIAFGSGGWGMDSPTVEFGLGALTTVDSVTVRWPDGEHETWRLVPVNHRLDLVQGSATAVESASAAAGLRLDPPAPNPANPRTVIAFSLTRDGPVRLVVHDLRGREVAVLADGPLAAGPHRLMWDGADSRGRAAASGAYLVILRAEGVEVDRKVTLVR